MFDVVELQGRFGFGIDIERATYPAFDMTTKEAILLNGFIVLLPFCRLILADEEREEDE